MAEPKLILASTSRYRKELLERLGIPFTCEKPEVDETPLPGETPAALSLRLACAKARAVADRFPGAVVIGSDQVCDLAGRALGKPHDHGRAAAQLSAMSGQEVVFHTAVCVIGADGSEQGLVSDTVLRMRSLSPETIEDYLQREKPYDCAGSAKIEKLGIALMQSVHSDDPTSLIGLPLMAVTTMLAQAGLPAVRGLQ